MKLTATIILNRNLPRETNNLVEHLHKFDKDLTNDLSTSNKVLISIPPVNQTDIVYYYQLLFRIQTLG